MNRVLLDRVILVTGAAGTLGRAAATACAAESATVILLDKHIGRLERVYDDIVARGLREPAIYPLDLLGATEQDYAELAATVTREFGALHGLLHAAAELGTLGPAQDLAMADVDRLFRINCSAPLQLTRALLDLMQRTGDASIVFTSDHSARRAKAFWGAYGISKLAIEGFASILADELERPGKIRVNTLVPGPFRSPIHLRAYPAGDWEALPGAERPAATLVYLLSPASRGLHGRVIECSDATLFPTTEDEAHVRT